MNVHYGVKQKSQAWLQIRTGIPTASNFSKIVTAVKGDLSESRFAYLNFLLAERMMGCPLADTFESGDMTRGNDMEPEAFAWYAMETGLELEEVTFVSCEVDIPLMASIRYGCSPDRFADKRSRVVEFKSPAPATHVQYLTAAQGWKGSKLELSYRPQHQGQMLCCNVDKADIVSYHPSLPKVLITVGRDEEYLKKLETGVQQFCCELEASWEKMKALYGPFDWPNIKAPTDPNIGDLGVSMEDVDAILEA